MFFSELSLVLIVVIDAINSFLIAIQSLLIDLNSRSVRCSLLNMRSSQYMVSFVSLRAISNFDIKSFLLCANCASATLAPTEVPARNNWFIIDEGALRSCNTLAQAIILSLNASDFSLSTFEDISASITHSAQRIIIPRSGSSFGASRSSFRAADYHSAPADFNLICSADQ